MARPKTTDYLTMEEATKKVYELTGVTRKKSSLYKWAKEGRYNRVHKIVRLRTNKKLGTQFTTEAWLKKFIEEIG